MIAIDANVFDPNALMIPPGYGLGFPKHHESTVTVVAPEAQPLSILLKCGCTRFNLTADRVAIVPCVKHTPRYSKFWQKISEEK
jgi:hypothetical protein